MTHSSSACKRALVTGATGQDGSYLCELLLALGYSVTAMLHPSGDDRLQRIRHLDTHPSLDYAYGDITDPAWPFTVALAHYDEVYHLAALTHVVQSYRAPTLAMETNATSVARLLHALYKHSRDTRMYFAATSEMFGTMPMGTRADERYPLAAQSPYAAAKVAAHLLCRVYRERGLYVTSGIAFNHESFRRGLNFVTRKLGVGVRNFKRSGTPVTIGNVKAMRDWHHAADTVRAMHTSLQQPSPGEYVLASGIARTVESLARDVCAYYHVPYEDAVKAVASERRPWDVEYLCGDATLAHNVLGWTPAISWDDLVEDICREV